MINYHVCCCIWAFFVFLFSPSDALSPPSSDNYFLYNIDENASKLALFPDESQIVRGRITTDVLLPCSIFKDSGRTRALSWWHCGSTRRLIGDVDGGGAVKMAWTRDGSYTILKNETFGLFLKGARRELVDRYECVVVYESGERLSKSVWFRLDFSFWYDFRWDSLFFGSCLASLVFCAASFVLNVVWIGIRKTVLWWINRAERMSRVRSMVEAMEKYRQRQMENLHETYHRRVTVIRDNYHQQVEQLRGSYANQVGRFRGYRQAQMENVTQHLDSIRDNYNQQLSRIREYGSRRTEQLWENYERQLNRMRMFTLEHRLKLMRQYKVKQRYINKLLESLADSTHPDDIQKRESEIRAALDLPMEHATAFPHATISRSSSYFSLPEFVMEDEPLAPPPPTNSLKYRQNLLLTADMASTSQGAGECEQMSCVDEPRFHPSHHQLFGPPELGGMVVVNHSHQSSANASQHPHNWNTATVRSAAIASTASHTPSDDFPPLNNDPSDAGHVMRRVSRSFHTNKPGGLERQRGDSEGHYHQDDDENVAEVDLKDANEKGVNKQSTGEHQFDVESVGMTKNGVVFKAGNTPNVTFVDELPTDDEHRPPRDPPSDERNQEDERLAEQEKLLGDEPKR